MNKKILNFQQNCKFPGNLLKMCKFSEILRKLTNFRKCINKRKLKKINKRFFKKSKKKIKLLERLLKIFNFRKMY